MATTTTFNDSLLPAPALVEAETYEPASVRAVTLTDPKGAATEQYRVLRYRLECLATAGHKALAFTSALGQEGKTTTAVNAALALGRGGKNRVALVDADLRRPAVHTMLGLRPKEGLCDLVAGRTSLAQCMWRFGEDALYVLPAGNVPDDLATTLYDPRLSAVLSELKSKFDFVLVDTAPALSFADVPTLCRDLDGAILVVQAGRTSRDLVRSALRALYGVPVHGTVLNELDHRVAQSQHLLATATASHALVPQRS